MSGCHICGKDVRTGDQHEHTEFTFKDGALVGMETFWSSLWPIAESRAQREATEAHKGTEPS